MLDLRASDNLINGLRAYGPNGVWTEPDFSKTTHSNSKPKTNKKRKSASASKQVKATKAKISVAASKQVQNQSQAANQKISATTTYQAKSTSSVRKKSIPTKSAVNNKIDLCNDDADSDDSDDESIDLCNDDMDDDLMAGLAGSLGNQQGETQAVRDARAAAMAVIVANKTRWQTRIDGIIAAERIILAGLEGEHKLLDFNRHQLRQGEKKLTQQQCEEFWTLPGVAQTLSHLRYDDAEKLIGLMDTPKWRQPELLTNTCPFDSAIQEAHRMLCADAHMLILLQQQASNEHATVQQREAANIILDMHRFAKARMWDAARLVVVRHALFVGNVYDHIVPSTFLSEKVLDLTATCNHMDRLFSSAGASIGGFTRVRKQNCDHDGCELNLIPNVEILDGSNIEFPRQNGNPTFQDRITHWFSPSKKRCKKPIGYVHVFNIQL